VGTRNYFRFAQENESVYGTSEPFRLQDAGCIAGSIPSAVVFSPDGQTLAPALRDNTVRLWDSKTGQSRHTLEGHSCELVHQSVDAIDHFSRLREEFHSRKVRSRRTKHGSITV